MGSESRSCGQLRNLICLIACIFFRCEAIMAGKMELIIMIIWFVISLMSEALSSRSLTSSGPSAAVAYDGPTCRVAASAGRATGGLMTARGWREDQASLPLRAAGASLGADAACCDAPGLPGLLAVHSPASGTRSRGSMPRAFPCS